jgi:soluble lytic murein transglycosylase
MFKSSFLFISSVLFIACFGMGSVLAADGDDEFLRARTAFDRKNAIALSEYVQRLQSDNYILASYAEYWLQSLNLEEADNQSVLDFINLHNDYPFANKLRGEYLKKVAKNQEWEAFSAEIDQYTGDDAAIACYAAEAKAIAGDKTALEAAKPTLWMQPKEQPGTCVSLYDRMQAAGVLTEDDVIARFRLALADSRISLAKSIIKRSKYYDASQFKAIDKAYYSPTAVIDKKLVSLKTKFGREVNLFALNRLAKNDSYAAFSAYNKIESQLQPEEQSYFYGRLANYAAQRHEIEALQWYAKTDETVLNKEQLAWYARIAMRNLNWEKLLAAVNKMDATQATEPPWRYWKARALKERKELLEANTLFAKLSTERHFYGWLAQEEMDGFISAAPVAFKTNEQDVAAIASNVAFQRVEALQNLDMRVEAKAEWVLAVKDFDDKQFLAAAAFASRKKWYDLSVSTADKTTETHDFALRYPTPYRDLMKPAAKEQNIDEAWVYGITRQESRFMHYAKSGVGASGLMQLMPATARWAASRAGISHYNNNMIHELDTNVALGTYYLRYTLDTFNGQEAMATAAYNAGPNRAKKWAAAVPLEGAIYAENIPFTETRLYVQRVLANAHLYAKQLGLKPMPLKSRLGTIPSNLGQTPVVTSTNDDTSPELTSQ